jgi:transcriptional regulator with GAF, ATPase, and Fis domain
MTDDRMPVWAIWLLLALVTLQLISWFAAGIPTGRGALLPFVVAWINLLLLAALVSRRFRRMRQQLSAQESAHLAAREEVDALQLQNEMLQIIARAPDVPEAFQSLAPRIAKLVPCDRLGLALLSEDGQEFQTFTARMSDANRPMPSRPDVVFKVEGTALGQVVRSAELLVIDDARRSVAQYLDVAVLAGAGFNSALLVPLVSKGRAVGTLNLVAKRAGAFTSAQGASVQPMAEILAVAWMVQQLQLSLGRFRTMEVMSEITLSIAAEINSALQAVIGGCDLIRREYADERLRRDLDTIIRQSERIAKLLERMRATTHQRMQDVAATVRQDPA